MRHSITAALVISVLPIFAASASADYVPTERLQDTGMARLTKQAEKERADRQDAGADRRSKEDRSSAPDARQGRPAEAGREGVSGPRGQD